MHTKFDFSKGALADGLAQQVVTHVLRSQIGGAAILKPTANLWIALLRLIWALICCLFLCQLLFLLLLRSCCLVACLFLVARYLVGRNAVLLIAVVLGTVLAGLELLDVTLRHLFN